MKCSQIRNRLSAFFDGEVSEAEKFLISEHLKGCVNCQAEFDKLSQVSIVLDLIEEVEVSPYFTLRLKRRIAEEEAKQGLRLPFFEWAKRVAVPVGVAALFIFAILGGNYLGRVLNQRVEKVAEQNEQLAGATGITSFEDFSEGSLVDTYNGLLTEGGK